MDIKARIEAAVKMLFASGRQLDIEAAKLIEELNQNAQAVGRMGNGLQDEIETLRIRLDEAERSEASLEILAESFQKQLDAARNKIADLYIERDIEMSRADELQARLDAVGPMPRAKAEERFEENRALFEENMGLRAENMMLRDAVRKHKVPVTVVPRPLMEDAASVRGAFVELAEVSEKLAKVLGRPLKDEDTPLLLADEVDREMLILKVQERVANKLGEQRLKTHQDWCDANHLPKAATIFTDNSVVTIEVGKAADQIKPDGLVFIDTVQSWMEGKPVGLVVQKPVKDDETC